MLGQPLYQFSSDRPPQVAKVEDLLCQLDARHAQDSPGSDSRDPDLQGAVPPGVGGRQ